MKNQAANNGTFIPKPGFTVVQNSVARDWNLSSGALGLYTRIQSYITIDANRERYRKTPTPPTGFSCPLGVFTQVVLGVVFRQSTTASKPLKRRPAIIGRACAGLNCRVNARKSPTL